jgi:hypothetical protein
MGHAIAHFLEAVAWCSILIISFIGWGNLVLRWLTRQDFSIGLAAPVGFSFAVLAGGVLNLLHLVATPVLICFTFAGCGLAIARMIRPEKKMSSSEGAAIAPVRAAAPIWQRLALLCFLLLFVFRMASTPRVIAYSPTDDEAFYLPAPAKMLEVHHFAADPYSERRIESSLGGSYFLQCLVLSALPLDNVQMADRFLGLILIVLTGLALARQFTLSSLDTTVFLIFSIAISPMDVNLTFTTTPTALWLALALIGVQREYVARPAAQALLVGLVAGTLCSLKSTYIPHAALACLAIYLLWGFQKGWEFAFTGWAFSLLGALLILVPWMIAMRMTSGTFLYPLLGPGYDFPAYHQFPMPYTFNPARIFHPGLIYFVPVIGIILAQCILLRRGAHAPLLLALAVACLLGTTATGLATGADSIQRYAFPIVMATLLLSYLQFSAERHLRPCWITGYLLQAGVIGALLLWTKAHFDHLEYATMTGGIETSAVDPGIDSPMVTQEYAGLSSALPKDGLILTTLQHPYLVQPLDRHILLADWPGCASLPPGWPIKQDGEALAKFLVGHSIRYLAYNYADNMQMWEIAHGTGDPTPPSPWLLTQCECYFRADRQYRQLKQSRKTVYDDGKVFVLDLTAPADLAGR